MDKLRALRYFIAAAEERSFSGAARQLEVSIPAVSKLVGALERSIGIILFHRDAQGLQLTAEGSRYLERCEPLVEELEDADQAVREGSRPGGVLTIGAPPFMTQHCLGPNLRTFHARYPEIELD